MFTILTAIALAGPPTAELRPAVVPWATPQRYLEWARARDRTDTLACDVVWADHAHVCFRLLEKGQRRWVTSLDLDTWGVDAAALRAMMVPEARKQLAAAQRVAIEGMAAHYYQLESDDGWAAAGILAPDELASKTGGAPILAAIPAEGMLVSWRPGVSDVDHVMLVGVRELYDALPVSVSPTAFHWDGTKWMTFGRVDPEEE